MKFFASAAVAVVILAGASANAATLNFENGPEEFLNDGDKRTFDGVEIEFSSSDFAYFDTSPANGGLGVCQTATNSCGSDDNLTSGETVTLTFDGLYDISGLWFNDADHNPVVATNTLSINDSVMTFAAASAMEWLGISSLTFGFGQELFALFSEECEVYSLVKSDNDCGQTGLGQDYYVGGLDAYPVNEVPLPAAGWLLLAGLGGLGVMKRRKTA